MKQLISNFCCIALYPKHLEEDSNSFIKKARASLIEFFGVLRNKPSFLGIFLAFVSINLRCDELTRRKIFHYRKVHF